MESWETCIHREPGLTGLCGECQQSCEEDPSAWIEFGAHPDGIENWKRLQEDMEADREEAIGLTPEQWADIPF